jgi:tetratricopeptide (TPR) repeat protein
MGRGSFGALGVGLALVAGLGLGVTACQPLYGGKPEKLVAPQKKKAPKEEVTEIPIKEVEECTADFRSDPKTVRVQTSQSNTLTTDGDTALASSDKASDIQQRVGLLREAIDKYRNALIKDPYNADATLKLALAYDRVYRKGCAIAMLKRLSSLTANPKYAAKATPAIDSIGDNGQWFKHYRKDAMAAVGR